MGCSAAGYFKFPAARHPGVTMIVQYVCTYIPHRGASARCQVYSVEHQKRPSVVVAGLPLAVAFPPVPHNPPKLNLQLNNAPRSDDDLQIRLQTTSRVRWGRASTVACETC
jgi:hypothetical protein